MDHGSIPELQQTLCSPHCCHWFPGPKNIIVHPYIDRVCVCGQLELVGYKSTTVEVYLKSIHQNMSVFPYKKYYSHQIEILYGARGNVEIQLRHFHG